jgi:hypothetical protein
MPSTVTLRDNSKKCGPGMVVMTIQYLSQIEQALIIGLIATVTARLRHPGISRSAAGLFPRLTGPLNPSSST